MDDNWIQITLEPCADGIIIDGLEDGLVTVADKDRRQFLRLYRDGAFYPYRMEFVEYQYDDEGERYAIIRSTEMKTYDRVK